MPSRAIYALVAGLVAAAAFVLLVAAGSTGTRTAPTRSSRSSARAESYALQLYTAKLIAHAVDVPPAGRSPGDEAVLRIPLHNDRGISEGSMKVTCPRLSKLLDAPSNCFGVVRLSSGKIMVAGNDSPTSPTVNFAIVGGTGAYHGEEGQVVGYRASGGVTVDIELRRRPAGGA